MLKLTPRQLKPERRAVATFFCGLYGIIVVSWFLHIFPPDSHAVVLSDGADGILPSRKPTVRWFV